MMPIFLMCWLVAGTGIGPLTITPRCPRAGTEHSRPLGGRTTGPQYEKRDLLGWTLHIHPQLLSRQTDLTRRAISLLQTQLEEIIRVVPDASVTELKKVPLWFSPEYPGSPPRAEYHPGQTWLKENGRDVNMVKGVEFTNIQIFEAETRRMPNFVLHELAHAFHDRVLVDGFANPRVQEQFARATASGIYERVERRDSEGQTQMDRAYALTNAQEYFAESTEAFFSQNDFYPYNQAQLKQHDPRMFQLLMELWRVETPATPAGPPSPSRPVR